MTEKMARFVFSGSTSFIRGGVFLFLISFFLTKIVAETTGGGWWVRGRSAVKESTEKPVGNFKKAHKRY